MANKFERELRLVDLLMQRIGISVASYIDPNDEAAQETGVDVIAVALPTGRTGIQVTELDTGSVPGQSRREEKQAARIAERSSGGVYGTWAQNHPARVLEAVERSIARKSSMTPAGGFDEIWLLVSCGII